MGYNFYKYNQEEVDSILSSHEIENLLYELEAETSILRKKPSDIERNSNLDTKQKELLKLKWLEEIYVLPLIELANRINMKQNKCLVDFNDLDSLSITGKTMKIRDFLISKGCPKEIFMQVVPKNEMEVNTLLTAKIKGFDLGFSNQQSLYNTDRVARARQYLSSIELNNSNNTVSNRYR